MDLINNKNKMFEIYVNDAVFAQAAKYMIIAKTHNETKRGDICSLWTSVPTFNDPIIIPTLQGLIIKACVATIDRKLTVIGSFPLTEIKSTVNQPLVYEGQHKFVQNIDEQQVCTGRCTLKILKKGINSSQANGSMGKTIDIDDQMVMEDSQDQEEKKDKNYGNSNQSEYFFNGEVNKSPADFSGSGKCQLRFIIHSGFDFYLNSGFRVCVKWGKQKKQTRLVMNKIIPFWGQMLQMENYQDKTVELSVEDDRGSKLEWIKMKPNQIRIMYPYHLKVKFRQQCMGAHPFFYITVLRQDVPRFSILDRQFQVQMRYIGSSMQSRKQQYLLIYRREVEKDQNAKLPIFMDLDMNNYVSFQTINSLVQKSPDKKYEWNHWNILIPVSTTNSEPLILLKSLLNQPLVCLYFSLQNPKVLFVQHMWNTVDIIDRKQFFDSKLKELYYKQKRIVMGKTVELTNHEAANLQNDDKAVSLEQKWKILTQNYILRKKLLEKSLASTQQTKAQIEQKGLYLQSLKKVLKEVKKMNAVMVQKERSAFVEERNQRYEKVQQNYRSYPLLDIITSLFEKQAQLERKKHINDQMRMRMTSLQHFTEDSTQLDAALIKNSEQLLQQQEIMKQMKKMKEVIPKQRQVIAKLEQLFEKRQIDKHANDLLSKERQKLQQVKRKKRSNLQNVYELVKKQNQSGPHNLLREIQQAEKQLIKLNMEYVKLTN